MIEHVIFDCDGVLVDSERVAIEVDRRILAGLGWHLSTDEIIDRFVGRTNDYFVAEVARHTGQALPLDWDEQITPLYRAAYEEQLVAVPGIVEALDVIDLPTAVATNGTHDSTAFKLGLTGLLEQFKGHIFSASDVANGKPLPDLYLYTAATMGWHPSTCIVVEDSPTGIAAGLAAGMRVIGYTGGVSGRARIERSGITLIDDMRDLPAAISTIAYAG